MEKIPYEPNERCPDCYSHCVIPVGDRKVWNNGLVMQRFACMGNPYTGELCGREFDSSEGYKSILT